MEKLVEQAGDASPHAMQRLLEDAVWDADAVRDDLRRYVADELGEPGRAKGERDYDWARIRFTPPDDEAVGHHWLLVRRSISDGELAYYRWWSPRPVTLATLVRVPEPR